MVIEHITLDDVYRFMENGNPDNAPADVVVYLQLLDRVHGMINRLKDYGNKQSVIKHLIVSDGLSRYKANQVYQEAIEYFYMDKTVSRQAWANFYAEIVDQEITFVRMTKKNAHESKRVGELVKIAAELRGVFQEEKEELPEELFQRPFVVYTGDITKVKGGFGKSDRNKIKELIDSKSLALTEKEKQRLYQEADIIPFIALPNEQEDPRRS